MSSKVLAAGVLSLGLGFGATVACAQRQPETFFKNRIGLSDSDIQKMDQGQVVTKVLESGDKKYGILVFGGVYVNTSIEKFAASYRDVKGLLEDKVYLDVQAFNEVGSPPKLSDFDRLAFDRKDIDAIQKCKPDNCDLQVFDVTAFQKQINWDSSDKYDQVNKLARQRIYDGTTKYISGGLKAFGSYTDRNKPFNLYQNMKSMLDTSYYLPPDKSRFYLIEMNDSRMPDYGGIKLSIVRKIATEKGVQSTRDILSLYNKRLSGK